MDTEEIKARLEAIQSREQIRELPAKYVWASARANVAAMVDLFTEDCDFAMGLPGQRVQIKGRQAVFDLLTRMVPAPGAIFALIHNQTVEMHGPDAASGTCVMHNPVAPEAMRPFIGYYQDDFRRVDGVWLFSGRNFRHYTPQFDTAGS
jgi:uncharacterized protein (TIGR02246 family)